MNLLLAAALLFAAPASAMETLRCVVSGKERSVDAYRVGAALFLRGDRAAQLYGARFYWRPASGKVQLSLRGTQVQLVLDSKEARIGSKPLALGHPVLVRASIAFIPLEFFLSPEFAELARMDSRFDAASRTLIIDKREEPNGQRVSASTAPVAAMHPKRRVVIDAGHGGKDSGTVGRRRTLEKTVNLAAALELAELLREDGRFEVLLTRDKDVFVPLAERSRMANEFNADLFVSLHCNWASQRSENGYEIYFLSEKASDPEAERVADVENSVIKLEGGGPPPDEEAALLLHAMAKTEYINGASVLAGLMTRFLRQHRGVSMQDRGVKQAAFYVLRGTDAPAVLVEMGFLSHAADESKLGSKRFRRRLVEALHRAIAEFAARQDWSLGAKHP